MGRCTVCTSDFEAPRTVQEAIAAMLQTTDCHFTDWSGPLPDTVKRARLRDDFELRQHGHVMHSQNLERVADPYLTFRVESSDPHARFVDHLTPGTYTLHVADPRMQIEGVTPREPWFNTTIAVSHRWLGRQHPDPDGEQFRELLTLCELLGFHDTQSFLIDYCSLPQQPRTPEEEDSFRSELAAFQAQFKYVVLVLNTGSTDYARRCWCMLELVLAATNRAPSSTLLNHDRLDEPLRAAVRLAQDWGKSSEWNQQQMLRAFGAGGLTRASYSAWTRNPINVALYNASIDRRREIVELFEQKLEVTDERDRAIIVDLLKTLAFGQHDVAAGEVE